jgi:hypothetical protein
LGGVKQLEESFSEIWQKESFGLMQKNFCGTQKGRGASQSICKKKNDKPAPRPGCFTPPKPRRTPPSTAVETAGKDIY